MQLRAGDCALNAQDYIWIDVQSEIPPFSAGSSNRFVLSTVLQRRRGYLMYATRERAIRGTRWPVRRPLRVTTLA